MKQILSKLKNSLVGKSILFISAFLICTIFIMTFIFIDRYKGEMFTQLKKRGVSIANNFSYNSEYGLLVEDAKGLGELIDDVMKEDDIEYVIVLDKAGKIVAASKKGMEKDAMKQGKKIADLEMSEKNIEQWETAANEQLYDISVPIITVRQDSSGMFGLEDTSAEDGQEEKIGMVKVGLSLTSTIRDIGSTTGIIIFIALIILLISNLILMYAVNGALSPIKIAASAAQAIAKGDLSHDIVIKKTGNDEIGQLSRSFTKMIEVLRESEKIRESEQILDASASAMRIIDLEGNIMKVNKTMARISGVSKEDSVGKKCHEVMDSPMCKTEDCPIFKVQEDYKEISVEIKHLDENGKLHIYLMSAMPFYNNTGEVIGIIEDMRDITELKESEQQIKNTSDELSRAITEYFEVLDRIGAGDPDARASEESSLEIVSNLGKSINQTAVNMGEFIKQFNELAINITEKFQVIQQVASGDLTAIASEDTGDELMMKMGQVLNRMISNLKKLITDVSAHASLVTQSASSLAEISDQSTDTISQLSSTMQQISESTNLVATSSQRASTSSASADQASREGRKIMNLLLEKMQVIQVAIDTATSTMHELEKRSEKISEIVQVITKIADQTNLLSLNAAIEAARAGEAGRGFAVVADEVRKLAESSTFQAQQISSIIQEVVTNTQLAVERVNVGLTEVQKGRDLVDSAHEMFIQVADNIETVANQVEGIAGAAEESAASAQQATAGAEEQNASIEEISASSTELFEGSKKVQEALRNFKLE